MAKGIIYVMSTCVNGLVKIGKTGVDNFEQRMSNIERDGYHRISVLNREFAIEVDEHDKKEKLLHEIFSKSRVGDSELFSVDINLVKQLLASMEGKIIYPEDEEKKEVFDIATEAVESKSGILPNGNYYLKVKTKTGGDVSGTLNVKDGNITLCKGAKLAPVGKLSVKGWRVKRDSINVDSNNFTLEDVVCDSPSMASSIIEGHNSNGWNDWKTSDGKSIDVFRQNIDVEDNE